MPPDTSNSLANLGDLTKPANTLIKKISGAVGVLFEPRQIERVAKAEAEAALTRAKSEIEITELHRRAARRWIEEEAQRQKNMENITIQAVPQLNENAEPESVDNDWIVNFFDKCRIVSDSEMQGLWSRVLAGEANAPGSYSKRTVNFLLELEKAEAHLFTQLCGFGWMIGELMPLVFDCQAKIYNRHKINFDTLSHLKNIGLVQFDNIADLRKTKLPKSITVFYYDQSLHLNFPNKADNSLNVGKARLTSIGQELAPICGSKPVDGFREYVEDQWKNYLPTDKKE